MAAIGSLAICLVPAGRAQQSPTSKTSPATLAVPVQHTPAKPPNLQDKFIVVLDPAHGGSETGAMLTPSRTEKDYTLALAVRLHVLLNARGIPSILTRDTDIAMTSDARAEAANRAHATACIVLHATASGDGVHLFTSSLPPIEVAHPRQAFLPWSTAQASFITPSLRLESEINTALGERRIPALLERTSLTTLDSMACPAVAVEIAPLNAETPVVTLSYQEEVAETLAKAIAAWQNDGRLPR